MKVIISHLVHARAAPTGMVIQRASEEKGGYGWIGSLNESWMVQDCTDGTFDSQRLFSLPHGVTYSDYDNRFFLCWMSTHVDGPCPAQLSAEQMAVFKAHKRVVKKLLAKSSASRRTGVDVFARFR